MGFRLRWEDGGLWGKVFLYYIRFFEAGKPDSDGESLIGLYVEETQEKYP
jgi:hypothetical protein